jgi:hypothetical protein
MSWGAYAILVLFGLFVLLLIVNPKMSCFGKRVRSPFYPLSRRGRARKKTTDYHFDLGRGSDEKPGPPKEGGEGGSRSRAKGKPGNKDKKTHDYGFHLD